MQRFLMPFALALAFGSDRREKPSGGLPEVSATRRYASAKARGTARCNHRHREKGNAQARRAQRAKLDELGGRQPGYRIEHHDALVRRFGARATRSLEHLILRRRLAFTDAIAAETAGHAFALATGHG